MCRDMRLSVGLNGYGGIDFDHPNRSLLERWLSGRPARFPRQVNADIFINKVGNRRQYPSFRDMFRTSLKSS